MAVDLGNFRLGKAIPMANDQVAKMDDEGGADSAANAEAPTLVVEDEAASDGAGNEDASTLVAFTNNEPTPSNSGSGTFG